MENAKEIRDRLEKVSEAYRTGWKIGTDPETMFDLYLEISHLEDMLSYAEKRESVLSLINETIDSIYSGLSIGLGKRHLACSDSCHDRYIFLHLTMTELGTIYCVQHKDEYGLIVDDLLTFSKEKAAEMYISILDLVIFQADDDDELACGLARDDD